MKKKIGLIFILSFILCGIVSAASVWGVYKGNTKVKVIIAGNTYSTNGVPPIIYNGQVMLPLNVLNQVGVVYIWDSTKQTVTVNSVQSNNSSLSDIEIIKTYGSIANFFYDLESLGNSFITMDSSFSTAIEHIQNSPDLQIQNAQKNLDNVTNKYNALVVSSKTYTALANSVGLTNATNIMNPIMNKYSSALNYYKDAFTNIQNFDKDNNFVDKWYNNVKTGSDLFFDALTNSSSAFSATQNLIINYQPSNLLGPSNSYPTLDEPITTTTINSKIDGDFDGFDNGKIFKLTNGQIWEQVDYTYKYSYKFSPDVTIYKDGSSYVLIVDGVDKKVKVNRLK